MYTCKNLKFLREKKDITQEELAEQIGITRQMISYIERGLKEPSTITLIRIANFLDCSLDDLVGRR